MLSRVDCRGLPWEPQTVFGILPTFFRRGHDDNPYESCSAAGNVFALRQFCVCHWEAQNGTEPPPMHGLIYLIGLIVVILFILSFFGLR